MNHLPHRAPVRTRGFSVPEILATLSVALLASVAFMHSRRASENLKRSNAETRSAIADLEGAMERIRSLPVTELPLPTSPFADGRPFTAEGGLPEQAMTVTYPGYVKGQPVPDPLEIVVTVTWKGVQDRPRELQLATMRTR